ncbi:MAG TPA: efflux RND transporter periplasmic adaptor subunit [Luteimonas sp.]|nr:efflux RND transporter periplasmic adaptor subunit [Luteimonas sp.]
MRRILIAVLASSAIAACGKPEAPQAPPPPEVGVISVTPTTVPLRKELVGRLAPYRSADVRARAAGVLERRVYEEGSDVTEGQVLFQIDPAPLRAELGNAQAAVAQAQANAVNARAAANRARQLAPSQFISRADVDNALAAERSANAAVQAGNALLQSSQISLGYATVRAPISGRAGKQQVTEGALVGQGDATLLTTVDQIDQLYVNFSMSVAEFAQVRALQGGGAGDRQVQVLLPDGTPYPLPGVLDFSGDVVDPATGAVALRALIPNPDKRLLPGSYVTIRATLGQLPNAFVVPQAAVLRDARGPYVMTVGADGKALRKDIATERAEGSNWIVTRGLAANDRVVLSGVQKAQQGQPVKAVPWKPASPAGAPGAGAGAAGAGAGGKAPAAGDRNAADAG